MNSQAGFIVTLIIVLLVMSAPFFVYFFRLLRSVRKNIERKIDAATNINYELTVKQIQRLQADVNELKSEMSNFRTIAALINRVELPECIKGKS